MQVYIEQPGEKNTKNAFDKKTGTFIKSVPFHLTYPYPYGYILNTKAPDGDGLDCYIITKQKFETGSIIECEPIGMEEWFEDDEEDHKILAIILGEQYEVDDTVIEELRYFATHFFEHAPRKNCRLGEYYGKEKAEALINKCQEAYQGTSAAIGEVDDYPT